MPGTLREELRPENFVSDFSLPPDGGTLSPLISLRLNLCIARREVLHSLRPRVLLLLWMSVIVLGTLPGLDRVV